MFKAAILPLATPKLIVQEDLLICRLQIANSIFATPSCTALAQGKLVHSGGRITGGGGGGGLALALAPEDVAPDDVLKTDMKCGLGTITETFVKDSSTFQTAVGNAKKYDQQKASRHPRPLLIKNTLISNPHMF